MHSAFVALSLRPERLCGSEQPPMQLFQTTWSGPARFVSERVPWHMVVPIVNNRALRVCTLPSHWPSSADLASVAERHGPRWTHASATPRFPAWRAPIGIHCSRRPALSYCMIHSRSTWRVPTHAAYDNMASLPVSQLGTEDARQMSEIRPLDPPK